MNYIEINQQKKEIRDRIWELLEREHAVPAGVHGSIPAFFGAELAADRLAELPEWQAARVIKAVPDRAQLPVRARALREGKIVYMAVPRLAEKKPFFLLDPSTLTVSAGEAATSKMAAAVAPMVGVEEMSPVDLIICGSVAVNRQGVRLGKGAGYSDIEVALLEEAGLIGSATRIVTTVHSIQVINDEIPETVHDFSVDVIVTQDEIITCGPPRRPKGLYWDNLGQDKIASIPVLAARLSRSKSIS